MMTVSAVPERRAQLRSVWALSSLTDDELDRLAAECTWSHIDAGEKVLSHLSDSADVFFVVEGEFRAELSDALGHAVPIRQLRAGAHFGEIAALTGAPRSASIVARTAGLVAVCPASVFRELMHSNSVFAANVATTLARSVVLLTDRVFELAALEVRFRLLSELLRLAQGGESGSDGILIRNAPTHDQLAATIGTHREAVTREFSYLAGQGLIQRGRGRLVITDIARLRDIIQKRAGAATSHVVSWSD